MTLILIAVICAFLYMYFNNNQTRSLPKARRIRFEPVIFRGFWLCTLQKHT